MRSLRIGLLLSVLGVTTSAQPPASWTSHDKLALTYFFYWFDTTTGLQYVNATLHPPDSYVSTYRYADISFYQRELSDMAAAGIDVVLPVYWGDAGSSTWSVPGLRTMVQAEQAMAQAGQPAPKIGMFDDTGSLVALNGGTAPDLTTASGKNLFYGEIHSFFSIVPKQFWAMIDGRPIIVLNELFFETGWDQSSFDYVSQQFQQDFGTTPYIIRHVQTTGVKTDAAYMGWSGSLYRAVFMGDVASVGPGGDNLNLFLAKRESVHVVSDRNCGDLYQRLWDQVVSRGARLVLVETWNELGEGSGVAASKEYGRRYIDKTARNVARWKSSPSGAPPSPSIVWTSLGPQPYTSGLAPNAPFYGATHIAGHEAMFVDYSLFSSNFWFYFEVDDGFLPTQPAPVWVTVEYLDSGNAPWSLEYDGAGSPYTATAPVTPQNTGLWRLQTFYLPDAIFQKRQRGYGDFRIVDNNPQGAAHYFNRVWVTKSPPSGPPPQMPLVADVAVQAGSSADIPLAAFDSSGRPLLAPLQLAPGFASSQGAVGSQTIHLAPSLADVRSCADVIRPGVTSSSSYIVSAVANDPARLLGSGATTFSVNVTTPPPVITAVYDPWDYTLGIAPGAWVSISGTGLAAGAPQTWNPTGKQLPTTLNNVMVVINGTPAVLSYVSATQINALVPSTLAPGPAQVIVESNGINSSAFTATATATLPAIYALPGKDGRTLFVTAALAGTATLVGNLAVDPRVVRAAQPGDMLDLYVVGLGATQDASKFITNQVFSGAYPVSANVTATVGGENATVLFAGLVSPGLYLVRVQVPADVAPGPQSIQVSAGASPTSSSLILMVQKAP